MPEKHALLSASSSQKWLHCPPSARLEASLPDNASEAAAAGTLAHAIGELKLRKLFVEKGMSSRTYNSRMKKLTKDPLYDPGMERSTDAYVDYIKEIAYGFHAEPMIALEQQVDYSAWAPEGFGTSDCILIQGTDLHIADYKNGKGVPVSAYDNPQMKLYALGALAAYGLLYPVTDITLHIVQPNLNNFSSWSLTKDELMAWGESIRPAAQLAFEGKGDFCQGEWCDKGFCRAAALCRKRMEENMSLMDTAADPVSGKPVLPPLITDEDVGRIMKKAVFLASWVKKLERYAFDTLLSGKSIPGWKLVEGRSNRVITDPGKAAAALTKAGYEEPLIYKPRELLAIGELEKLIEADDFKACVDPAITKPPGKPTLVPEDDRRPAMTLKTTAAEAFGGENTYKEEK